jgi:hypothetical protein
MNLQEATMDYFVRGDFKIHDPCIGASQGTQKSLHFKGEKTGSVN